MVIPVHGPQLKYPFFLIHFNETSIFSTDFQNSTQIPNFLKILPLEAELLHADRRTAGNDAANSRLSQFCQSPEKEKNSLM